MVEWGKERKPMTRLQLDKLLAHETTKRSGWDEPSRIDFENARASGLNDFEQPLARYWMKGDGINQLIIQPKTCKTSNCNSDEYPNRVRLIRRCETVLFYL
jgi:hypothetical protein